MFITYCRSGQGEQLHRDHSEKDYYRKHRRDDDTRKRERTSHSRSPLPPRSSGRDRPLRGESLKRESSSGRNSPMYSDERSRDSLREERFARDVEYEDSRHHERLSGPARFLAVREDSRHSERRGSREQKEMYEWGGLHTTKHLRGSGSRGGERGGAYTMHRDDRRGSLRVSRSPRRKHEHVERSRSSRPDLSGHYPRNVGRDQRREWHEKIREERKEKQHTVRHGRIRRKVVEEEKESRSANVVETINISSESGDDGASGEVRSGNSGAEKIDDLIRDLDSGSSSGEISEEESEKEETSTREEEEDEKRSLSEKDERSDGVCVVFHCITVHRFLVWPARPIPPLPFYMLRFIACKPQHIEWERGNGSSWPD